jgi:hypothetical protein
MSEMIRAADDVIEAFVAPDAPGPRKNAFEPMRRERFPGVKDVAQLVSSYRRNNGVNVIRHHHKFAELIAHAVEVHKTCFHNVLTIGSCQDASTATGVKPAIHSLGEPLVIFALLAFSTRFWIQA